jgi:hypothetical protein
MAPLSSGDRLVRAEFERRYAAQPEIVKAELVEGVVYVASPTHAQAHSIPHFHLIGWLATFLPPRRAYVAPITSRCGWMTTTLCSRTSAPGSNAARNPALGWVGTTS